MRCKYIRLFLSTVLAAVLASTIVVRSQSPALPPAAASTEEAAALAQYWVLLAQRRFTDAAATVAEALKRYPKNVSALALVVEATIARGGAGEALDAYETWLGRRTLEEPGVVHRIARAYLIDWTGQTRDAAARTDALRSFSGKAVRHITTCDASAKD